MCDFLKFDAMLLMDDNRPVVVKEFLDVLKGGELRLGLLDQSLLVQLQLLLLDDTFKLLLCLHGHLLLVLLLSKLLLFEHLLLFKLLLHLLLLHHLLSRGQLLLRLLRNWCLLLRMALLYPLLLSLFLLCFEVGKDAVSLILLRRLYLRGLTSLLLFLVDQIDVRVVPVA